MTTLPVDSQARKDIPLLSGCLRYFPAALAGVARWSKLGNDKHNPGEPLHHARGKSMDHGDCVLRHLSDIQDMLASMERTIARDPSVPNILDEADALSWRALALSQELHERFGGAPLAPGAKLPAPKQPPKFTKEEVAAKILDVRSPGADTFTPKKHERIHIAGCWMDTDHYGNCAVKPT